MSVKMRQKFEREICTAVLDALLAAGFEISVDNGGEEFELENSADRDAILKAMFLADEDRLYAIKNKQHIGWVYFVYGNDGWDVLSDYTVNLGSFVGDGTPVQKIVDEYAD